MSILPILIYASLTVADDIKFEYSSSLFEKIISEEPEGHESYKFTTVFKREDVHFCTASLISNKHALTAAICLKDFLTEKLVPEFDLYSLEAGRLDVIHGSTVFQIEQVQAHRRYSFSNPYSQYNTGIITLTENNITVSEHISFGRWATQINKPFITIYKFTSWVKVHGAKEDSSFTLKQMKMKVIDNNQCGFRSDGPIICAVVAQENETLSEEDIGAPITHGKLIMGVLANLPTKPGQSAVFIKCQKYYNEITRLVNDCSSHCKISLPRKKARKDLLFTILSESRNVKPKHNQPKESSVLH